MRVKVSELSGFQTTHEAGQQVYDLIEPAIARGEGVVLDFDGVRYVTPGFFALAIGLLIEKDVENRLPALIQYENLNHVGQLSLESATEHWTRRREIPGWGAAWDAAAQRFAERMEE